MTNSENKLRMVIQDTKSKNVKHLDKKKLKQKMQILTKDDPGSKGQCTQSKSNQADRQ